MTDMAAELCSRSPDRNAVPRVSAPERSDDHAQFLSRAAHVRRTSTARLALVIVGAWLCGLLAGCGSSTANLETARQHLQLGRPQDALDVLLKETSAEALYLKSIALYRLELPEAADQELANAVIKDRKNPKYKLFQMRMNLLQGKDIKKQEDASKAAQQLVEACRDHMSSSVVALCAASGYATLANEADAVQAFKTSVALSDEARELQPEMLNYALRAQLKTEAQTVLDKLLKLAPDDPIIRRQKISVFILLEKFDEAIADARALHESDPDDGDALLLYARAMATGPARPDSDAALAALQRKHVENHELLVLYSTYLARSNRMEQAVRTLNEAVGKIPANRRLPFLHLAISLPLEAEQADIAERQLKLYRAALQDPLFALYYEGRILVARRQLHEAATRFAAVVDGGKTNVKGSRLLAAEAAAWLKRIELEKQFIERLGKAADEGRDRAYGPDLPPLPAVKPPSTPAPGANPAPATDTQ